MFRAQLLRGVGGGGPLSSALLRTRLSLQGQLPPPGPGAQHLSPLGCSLACYSLPAVFAHKRLMCNQLPAAGAVFTGADGSTRSHYFTHEEKAYYDDVYDRLTRCAAPPTPSCRSAVGPHTPSWSAVPPCPTRRADS